MKTEIEYLDDIHAYLINGVIVPSVSELLRFQFPDAYKGVPEKVLKQKADYGTKVHDMIQKFAEGEISMEEIQKKRIDPNIKIAVEQFEELRKKWAFHVEKMEQIVHYKNHYCGRYDIKTIDGLLIDLKTTSQLHTDWLAAQLGLYQLADGIDSGLAYCIWLPKGKAGKVVAINPWTRDECVQLVKEYEKHTSK